MTDDFPLPSPLQVIQMGMAIIFPFVLLSGILWPLIAMPDALRVASLLLPATVPAEVARAVVLNQGGNSIETFLAWVLA